MNLNNLEGKINHIDLKRKLLHMFLGTIGLLILIYNLATSFMIFMVLIVGILISLISTKYRIPGIAWCLDNFERKQENKLPGRAVIFAFAGTLLVLQLFPRNIALASVSILIFADPISHLVGKVLGKTNHFFDKTKNIEGHIAGILFSSIIAMFFVSPGLAISGAIMAMLFESIVIEIQKIPLDDNLIIPLVAGTTMFLIIKLLL